MTYRLDGVFTAIADSHRRQILDYLLKEELTAGELAERFSISRPAIANHLKVLEDNHLIKIRKVGRHRIHSISPEPLKDVWDWVKAYDAFWGKRLQTLKHLVEASPNNSDEDHG